MTNNKKEGSLWMSDEKSMIDSYCLQATKNDKAMGMNCATHSLKKYKNLLFLDCRSLRMGGE